MCVAGGGQGGGAGGGEGGREGRKEGVRIQTGRRGLSLGNK